eukprot:6208272-Pleurochrysis_carterae.AAC.6
MRETSARPCVEHRQRVVLQAEALAWNSGRLATKSVSQFSSTMMPSLAPAGEGKERRLGRRARPGRRADVQMLSCGGAIAHRAGEALLAQELSRSLKVTIAVDQRLLAIHHARAGGVAERLHGLGIDGRCEHAMFRAWREVGNRPQTRQ